MMDPLLTLRSIRYLRWEQLAYRPLRVAQYRLYGAFPQLASRWTDVNGKAPDVTDKSIRIFNEVFEKSFAHLNTPLDEYDKRLADLAENRFSFLNRTLTIDAIDWNRRYESHLWNYQLHYFNFAIWCARAFTERGDRRVWQSCQSLIDSWIEQARVRRSDGWDAYPTSLRIVNWIYAYALVVKVSDDQKFLERWRTSIYRQLDFLSRHLEFHLLANHLLKNVKALVIGGLFFDEMRWLSRGELLLWREFEEQVLDDGGHYERSPMYHAQAVTDFLECYASLRAFNRITPPLKIEEKLRAMAAFLEAMSYPDGTLALFNDSANTEETRPQPIIETAKRVCGYREKSFPDKFPQTGYYLWVSPDESEKIIVDAGPVSVDYSAAHAHCDMLSYELWLGGRPFIVDSGVHGYGADFYREYCRSTRGHNTVMFENREQSELWETFRMARRAKAIDIDINGSGNQMGAWRMSSVVRHYYDRNMLHERLFSRSNSGEWLIQESLFGMKAERMTSYIHLHPNVKARRTGDSNLTVECEQATPDGPLYVLITPINADGIEIVCGEKDRVQGWHFPDFGIARPSATIIFEYRIDSDKLRGYTIRPLN